MKQTVLTLIALVSSSLIFANEVDLKTEIPAEVLAVHKVLCPNISEESIYVEKMKTQFGELTLLTCEMYAYNSSSRLYYKSQFGDLSILSLQTFDEFGKLYATSVLNGAGLDVNSNTIGTFTKGRGLGDCGESATYIFDEGNVTLKLLEFRRKNECDGEVETEWPVIYSDK